VTSRTHARSTPTVTETAILATVGVYAVAAALAAIGELQDGRAAIGPLTGFAVCATSTILIWRRVPLARVAALVALITCAVSLMVTSLMPPALLPVLEVGLLLGDRRALTSSGVAADSGRPRQGSST
jgi:hypothetical protein